MGLVTLNYATGIMSITNSTDWPGTEPRLPQWDTST